LRQVWLHFAGIFPVKPGLTAIMAHQTLNTGYQGVLEYAPASPAFADSGVLRIPSTALLTACHTNYVF
jgi:hypothetical protein